MHRKNIRQMVLKQLKYNHPHWKRMTKKSKNWFEFHPSGRQSFF